MTKPILRVGKIRRTGRATPGSVGAHLSRTRPTANADPDRQDLNEWLIGSAGMDLAAAIDAVHRKAGVVPRADAVLANDLLLTVSPDWFRPENPDGVGTWDEDRLRTFRAEAEAFLVKTFGRQRVVAAVLHLDEATPHIQAVVVPILRGRGGQGTRLSSKDMFDPARLSALQQDWEDRLRPHGVGPRTKGSKARHTTLREYYGHLAETEDLDGRDRLSLSDPPLRGRIEGDQAYQERLKAWKAAEAKRLREELRPMAVEASRGRLYGRERASRAEVAFRLQRASLSLLEAREGLSRVAEELALTKDQIAALRAVPINQVAAALDWHEPVPAKCNAVDLVMRAGELDFRQATAWLAQRFGVETAATAVREHAVGSLQAAAEGPPVWTKAERTKRHLVQQQLQALAAPEYRITLVRERHGERFPENLGRPSPDAPEKRWTAREVLDLVPQLTAANLGGAHVYVTPLDPAVHHVLVDDLRADSLDELREEGYRPALVLESSPGNYQAVVKVRSDLPREATNSWFRDVNRGRGDPKITGLIHPFRLAGFENRKQRHQGADGRYPFVRLVEATNVLCRRAAAVIRAYVAAEVQPVERPRPGGTGMGRRPGGAP